MLTEVRAYSAWPSAPTLYLDEDGRAETDLIQIRNIEGLDPVLGDEARNIVLALHPNPDWDTWPPEALRRLLYAYFMPQQAVRLVFTSDDMPEVDIFGGVESFGANPFSKDPEYIASILCSESPFVATEPVILTGQVGDDPVDLDYAGNVAAGIYVKVEKVSGANPDKLTIHIGDKIFKVERDEIVNGSRYFQMSSFPRSKFVENVNDDATTTSLLSNVSDNTGSEWPMLAPGTNSFSITSDDGVQSFELRYFEQFGGL